MVRSIVRVLLVACCAAGLCACQSRGAARLVVERDTLLLYGPRMSPLPVRANDGGGHRLQIWADMVQLSSDTAVENYHGNVRCHRAGFADATVRVAGRTARVTVECRPALRFAASRELVLTVGQAPSDIAIEAQLASGAVERVRPLAVNLEYDGVVRVENNAFVPVWAGRTKAWVDLGGESMVYQITVSEVLANDTLSLRPGEFRTWKLARGRYALTVRPAAQPDNLHWLDLAAEGARCAPGAANDDTVYCVVFDSAGVGVRNIAMEGASSARRALVRLVRTP